ncbi:5-formyltetrahydrofolate cyclo-ligase [Piscinibacter sakaiensis]|nr:5-formyltetrahydrofolate cyclo-ligase [Piscinibacter sakaiensis]
MATSVPHAPGEERAALRLRLRAARQAFVASPERAAAEAALGAHLAGVLRALEPQCLGLYWPIRSEFNAAPACAADPVLAAPPWALPWTQRSPREMRFRLWDRAAPTARDECGLPCSEGAEVTPDVVLVPCLGYTVNGYRLGYGAGYFDRWMAAHPQVTAVGVAWAVSRLAPGEFVPEPHDQPLMLVVDEHGVVAG